MLKKKKILVVCPHPEKIAPGQRLKYEQYLDIWRREGYDVTVKPFYSDRMQSILYSRHNRLEKVYWVLLGYLKRYLLLFSLGKYDLVYIFLWVTPLGLPFTERLYCLANKYMVYDIDDAIFLNEKSVANRSMDLLRGRSKPFFLMRHARHVLVGTPFLAQTAQRYNKHVTDISVTIDTDAFVPVNRFVNEGKCTLGWSGSHSTIQFLYLLKHVLVEVNKQVPFKLLVMGDTTFQIEGIEIETIPWSLENEIPVMQRFDIGLYPLPLDSDWVLGKSGGKALQYMGIGIPAIATAVGTNYRFIEHGKTGYLVKTDQEWIDCILMLMKDPELRRRIGAAGRRTIETDYSLHANSPRYLAILAENSRP